MKEVKTIKERIKQLRTEMKLTDVQAVYISGTDPHQSEYMPEHWQVREFISGFTGSAGLVVITMKKAALWTDSRYFLQASEQLKGTGIELMKQRMPETPEPTDWLASVLAQNEVVGTDFTCLSATQYSQLKQALLANELMLKDVGDLFEPIWEDRPKLPIDPVFEHDLLYSGQQRTDKIKDILTFVKANGANATLITALDDLAWTFNLRGKDVSYNPVFIGFAFLSESKNCLFVNKGKLSEKLVEKLTEQEIEVCDYEQFYPFLAGLTNDCTIMIDADRTNQAARIAFPKSLKVVERTSVATLLKSQKSTFEIIHIRETMKKDGVAMVKFLYWLNKVVGKEDITEFDVVEQLVHFRSQQEDFRGISFYPIIGLNENGAIVHRSVTKESAASVGKDGILLFDSGGQYLGGTTDLTRTVALSEPDEKQKRDFTLVLKGMIGLSKAKFPVGTVGSNLDAFARKHLWANGLNYGHGTGHGVGYFLNVHEGPMSIRQEYNEQTIKPGMVLSNEPGVYREGEYGIRIENMIVCVERDDNQFGRFLGFETLTLCPIDLKLIDSEIMSSDELSWLNNYHQKVYETLSPFLDSEHEEYLKTLTQKIT
jgi:Xaa-Pro aminopeptidase